MPNWIKIRTEYETTSISYRKVAEKYDVSFNTLKDRAKREGWAKSKRETQQKITTKTLQKAVVKEADRNARHIALLDKVLDKAERVIDSELNVHLDMFGKPHKSPIIIVGRLEAISRILEKAQKGQRLALGLDKELDRQRLELERRKVDIAEKQADDGDKDKPINIIIKRKVKPDG